MNSVPAPPDSRRVRQVRSFAELITTPFSGSVNALCWQRTLVGDFHEVLAWVPEGEGIATLHDEWLRNLSLSAAGQTAVELLLEDLRLLREHNLDPALNCIHGYPSDSEAGPVRTDVFSFHADSAPVPTDTYLCTYAGPSSEGLLNEEAQRWVEIPSVRQELLQQFGGEDNAAFRQYLQDHCFDLHYALLPQARPYSFGIGHLWRIAVDHPGSPVLPCVHRAPATLPGERRLLLIS